MLNVRLPDRLRVEIEARSSGHAMWALRQAAARMSEGYRSGLASRLSRPEDRAAYLITRLPATYAAVAISLKELPFDPGSVLDLGAGPGTATLAVKERWGDSVAATLVEQNAAWEREGLVSGNRVATDLRQSTAPLPAADLVVAAFVLNELQPLEREALVRRAWEAASRALLLVEPGTPGGFEHVRGARRQLTGLGAQIQAPCPHQESCPMTGDDWCHFAVRVERGRLHRMLKGGELSYEDEKFSYLLVLKQDALAAKARILRHPIVSAGLIQLRLCGEAGAILDMSVRKRDPGWRAARKTSWGERWESEK